MGPESISKVDKAVFTKRLYVGYEKSRMFPKCFALENEGMELLLTEMRGY